MSVLLLVANDREYLLRQIKDSYKNSDVIVTCQSDQVLGAFIEKTIESNSNDKQFVVLIGSMDYSSRSLLKKFKAKGIAISIISDLDELSVFITSNAAGPMTFADTPKYSFIK